TSWRLGMRNRRSDTVRAKRSQLTPSARPGLPPLPSRRHHPVVSAPERLPTLALPPPRFMVKNGVQTAVPPSTIAAHLVPNRAFMAHAEMLDHAHGRPVVRADRRRDPMQAKGFEPEGDQRLGSRGGIALPLHVRLDRVAQLRGLD